MIKEVSFFACISLLFNCAQQPPQDSGLNHDFSKLSLGEMAQNELEACSQPLYKAKSTASPAKEKAIKMQASISKYIKHLAHTIMTRVNNSLEADGLEPLFSGVFAPSKFCFAANNSLKSPPNATMQPRNLTMTFTPSLLHKLKDESSIASVICHELAHATMNHGFHQLDPLVTGKVFSHADDEKVLNSAMDRLKDIRLDIDLKIVEKVYGKDSSQYHELSKISSRIESFFSSRLLTAIIHFVAKSHLLTDQIFLNDSYAQIFEIFKDSYSEKNIALIPIALDENEAELWSRFVANMDIVANTNDEESVYTQGESFSPQSALAYVRSFSEQLSEVYHGDKYTYLNWRESQADEVGLELCARAGIDISKYGDFFRHLVNRFSDNQEALDSCIERIESGNLPSRSTATHPDSCWRLFDVTIAEPNKHQADYEALSKQIEITPLATAEMLNQVLTDIEATKAP